MLTPIQGGKHVQAHHPPGDTLALCCPRQPAGHRIGQLPGHEATITVAASPRWHGDNRERRITAGIEYLGKLPLPQPGEARAGVSHRFADGRAGTPGAVFPPDNRLLDAAGILCQGESWQQEVINRVPDPGAHANQSGRGGSERMPGIAEGPSAALAQRLIPGAAPGAFGWVKQIEEFHEGSMARRGASSSALSTCGNLSREEPDPWHPG